MSRNVRFWILAVVVSASFCFFLKASSAKDSNAVWPIKSGPIPLVNQSPIQLLFLQPAPDRAETLGPGHGSVRLTTNLTNTLVSKSSSQYEATLDMEHIRTCLDIRYGVGAKWEIGFSLPVYHFYCGVLDGLIHDVERLFGCVRGIRGKQDKYNFTYSVKKDGSPLITGKENETGLGDAMLGAKVKLLDQGGMLPSLGARASIKLPTGSEGKAFGSGEFDWGLGLLIEKDFSPFSLYLNADVIFPGNAFKDEGVSLREFYTVMLAAEYGISPRFSLLTQLSYIGRPFEHTRVDPLDRRIWDLLIGVDYRAKNNLFVQFGFVEDIVSSSNASADITFFLNLGKHF